VTGIVTVFFAAGSFVGGDAINVNANAVTNTMGGTVTSQPAALFINAGSGGTAGFATWNVSSTNANSVNDIALGTLGSTAARTLNVTDDGSSTIIWNDAGGAQWAGLTTINALGTTGTLTITGGESGPNGLLSDDVTALTTVLGGAGADTFDLSAYMGTLAEVKGLSINGGANAGTIVELSNTEINAISAVASGAFAEWVGVPTLWDVGSAAVGGLFNMADFPGTLTVSLRSPTSGLDPDQTSNIVVKAAPDGLNFDFNSTDQEGHNFSVTGSDTAGGAGNVVNVNYLDLINSGFTGAGAQPTFSSANFDFVNINLTGAAGGGGTETMYFGGLTDVANTDSFETLKINASETHAGNETILVANVTTQVLGADDITLLGGAIIVSPPTAMFSLTGTLDITGTDNVTIGITNASTIASTTSGVFDMTSPDDINTGTLWVHQQSVTVSSTSAGSTLQGTLGAGALPGTGTDMLTDLAGGSSFLGDGGHDTIDIGGGGNDVFFGEYLLNDAAHTQTIDAGNDADLGFWGATSNGQAIFGGAGSIFGGSSAGGTSADMTTINGFTIGAGGDALTFHVAAFGGGLTDPGDGLNIGPVPTTAAGLGFAVGFAGEAITPATEVRVVLDEISQFTNANNLAQSMVTNTVGDFKLGFSLASDASTDFLVAYEVQGGASINIAEVHAFNPNGGSTNNTANMDIYAQDLVHLAGINFNLTTLGINLGEIHFS
jgi:hypothetical protein